MLVPSAAPGTWYVLLYSEAVPGPGTFTLTASSASIYLFGSTPDHGGTGGDTTLTLTGAGFDSGTTVNLVSGGNTFAAGTVSVDLSTQITATFPAGSVPAGVYDVQVVKTGGATAVLHNALSLVAGGRPGTIQTNLIVPSQLGNHIPGTIYVQYKNTGDMAMPAPLLVLDATQLNSAGVPVEQGLMTLDLSLIKNGLWTATLPAGFSHEIQFLAQGKTPGILQPGESVQVPVGWAGWQQPWNIPAYPPFNFTLTVHQTSDTTSIDWTSLKDGLRPGTISTAAWDGVFSNLTAQIGTTWGGFVSKLDSDASYLGRLGEQVADVGSLWNFEIRQAIGFSAVGALAGGVDARVDAPGLPLFFNRVFSSDLVGRNIMSRVGLGWDDNWDTSLEKLSDGNIIIHSWGGGERLFQPDSRGGYFAQPGDSGTLSVSGNDYLLTESSGLVTAYQVPVSPATSGALDYLEDTNGNKITAGYDTNGRLVTLTHSSGQSLAIAYNNGLISSVTDSTGRQTLYTYDAANQHLMSVTDFAGRVTQYAYASTGTTLQNALTSVALPDGTHEFFGYDAQGRLNDDHMDGNAEDVTFSYTAPGMVTVSNLDGSSTQSYFDNRGLVVKSQVSGQPAQYLTFGSTGNLTRFTDTAGQSYLYTYDGAGHIVQATDPLGNSQHYSYTSQLGRLASMRDANGNVTQYSYDSHGNPISTTYADGSVAHVTQDAFGDPLTLINRRGQSVQLTHDANGHVTSEIFADGSQIAYTYDGHSNLITAAQTDASGNVTTTTLTYDPITEELTQVSYPNGRSLAYSYDPVGRRTKMVDETGFTVNYHYDSLSRLASLTDAAGAVIVQYTYDAAGYLVRKDLGNGTYTTYKYDTAGQLIELVNHAPPPAAGDDGLVNSKFDYKYDVLGRVTAETTSDGQWV